MNFGTNFAIFVLFFGVAVLQAVQTRNWPWVVFWAAIGLYFLWTDIRYKGQPYPPTHKIVVALVTALAIGILAFFVMDYLKLDPLQRDGVVACTADAQLCPDGSSVGRVGPNCEFAACPAGAAKSARVTTSIGQAASVLDVKVQPLELLEDSRCAIDVQCIQAGTVRMRASLTSGLGTANQVFALGQTITTEAEAVTLVEVLPMPLSGQTVAAKDYRFVFEVKKR